MATRNNYVKMYGPVTAATSVAAGTYLFLGDQPYFSIQAIFTGSDVAGTFKLQRSIDGVSWADISGQTTSVTSSASTVLGGGAEGATYVRWAWAYTSGTGNLSVIGVIKQTPVYE